MDSAIVSSNYVASGRERACISKAASEPAWEEPLVGFSRGDDPLYQRFKEDIGPFYLDAAGDLRRDLSRAAGRTGRIDRDQLDPAADGADPARQQPGEGRFPPRRWAHSRKYGEDFNIKLRDHVVAVLREAGYEAVAPMNSPALEVGKIGPLRFCLILVGAACGVRRRPGHLRALRRPDHAPGQGDALRLRRGPDRRAPVGAALRRSPRLLPLLLRRELRQMHRALPGGRHHPGGA